MAEEEELQELEVYVKHAYLCFPSHTQFVESGVKEAAIVSVTGRKERNRSLLAILRSYTVEQFNAEAKTGIKRKIGNEKSNKNASGSKRNVCILKGCCRQYNVTKKIIDQGQTVALTTSSLAQVNHYQDCRRNKMVQKILTAKDKPLNAAQKTTGIERTAYAKGLVPYSKLLIVSIPLVRLELDDRNIAWNAEMNITALKKLLVADEKKQPDPDPKNFKPTSMERYVHLFEDVQ